MLHIKPLRPHHALCISFFEGKGYSPDFVANMTKVIKSLQQDTKVQLTDHSDVICISCPHDNDDLCNNNQKVRRYDEAVLSVCQLEFGQVLNWQELCDKVNNRIIRSGILHSICGDCQWNEICKGKADIKQRRH